MVGVTELEDASRIAQPLTEPERALAKYAAEQARHLKQEHRVFNAADSRRFRKIVKLAQIRSLPAEAGTEA